MVCIFIQITTFYENFRFVKLIGDAFRKVTSVHYQAILYTDHKNLQFSLRSKTLLKIANKLITNVHRVQQTMWQKVIQIDRE